MTILLIVTAIFSSYEGYEGYLNNDGNDLRQYFSNIRSELMDAEMKLYPEYEFNDDWQWKGNSVSENVRAIFDYSRAAMQLYDINIDDSSNEDLPATTNTEPVIAEE